jgi:signal transduction histidine kinase
MRTSTVAALLRLSSVRADEGTDWLGDILRIDSEALEVARVSYWSLHAAPPRIFCELCYIAPSGLFERGAVLHERSSPGYFAQLRKPELIDATDARADPRTRDLGSYLVSKKVGALLDAPVFLQYGLAGILCHEHVGGSRAWSAADQEFAFAIGQTISARLESHARNQSEVAEQRALFLSEVAPALAGPVVVEEVAEIAVRRALPILGEMATLAAYEEGAIRYRSAAHATEEGERLVADWTRRYPLKIESLHLISRALREQQSLVIPMVTPEVLAEFAAPGVVELARRLNIRSAMAVPLQFRGKITGAMSFLSDHRTYGQDDVRFAESYARQVSGILENTRLFQQAEQAIRVRDEFVLLASHELRTPLTALGASAQGILKQANGRDGASPESILRYGRIIARQVEQLGRLSERLLAASQIVGQLRLQTERFDLGAAVGEVARRLAAHAEKAGSRIRVEAAAPLMGVWDRGRIEQAVGNLLENAIKFGAGQPIEVTVAARQETAIISVRDHGIGISAEHLGRLFQRYQRAVSAQNFGGLGLGLYIVRVIVEAHGGTVRAESRLGEGATFVVELPGVEAAGLTARSPADAGSS